MEILQWFFSGIVMLFDQAVTLLAPFFQRLGLAFGIQLGSQQARVIAALFLTVFVAWLVRRTLWGGKVSMFEPQKIVLKTEKSPFDVVFTETMRAIGWLFIILCLAGGLIIAVTGTKP
jgi:hypothetical protein